MFYRVVRALLWVIFRILYRVEVVGHEKVPESGRLVLCSNHTSMMDPIMLAIATQRSIHFMAKKELFANGLLNRIFLGLGAFPVDRDQTDLKSIREAVKVLKDEGVLGLFPEGTRVKTVDRANMKAGVGFLANKGNSDIVPVHIDATYKLFSKVIISYKDRVVVGNIDHVEKGKSHELITEEVYKRIYEDVGGGDESFNS